MILINKTHQTKRPYGTDAYQRHTSHQTSYAHRLLAVLSSCFRVLM